MKEDKKVIRNIAQNRKAYHDYYIEDTYQAGIELSGTEVKSMRAGRCNFKDSYVDVTGRQAFIVNMHISPYEQGNIFNRDPLRKRRLLLHKKEILKLYSEVKKGGLTIIPLQLYFKGSRVKVEIGLCKGKQQHDKRQSIADRESKRTLDRVMKERNRY